MSTRLDGYIRVSRVAGRSGEGFISPTVQRERCEAAAKAAGHTIVRWHEDLEQPGSKASRPGFQAALGRIERGEVDGIVVAKLDRFARSLADAATALRRIADADGALISAGESLDTSTPFGRFAMHMMLAIAELELDRIRENWNAARAQAVARGVHIASRTPTGYDRDEARRLVPGPGAEAIAEVFRRKAAGASWGELAAILERAEVRTPYGGVNWAARSLTHLIANRVYLGEARSGEHVMPGAHEPLIDNATWQLAQRKAGTYAPPRGALLSGLVRCAGCRYCLKADKMRLRSGEKVRAYSCRGKRSSGTCEARAAVLGSVIQPWVIECFFARVGDLKASVVERVQAVEDAKRKLVEAEAELDVFLASNLMSVIGDERFREGVELRQAVVEDARSELDTAISAAGANELPDLPTLRELWPDLALNHQRSLLSTAIDAIFLRSVGQANTPIADRAVILWRGEAPADLPGVGRRVDAIRPFDWPDGDHAVAGI